MFDLDIPELVKKKETIKNAVQEDLPNKIQVSTTIERYVVELFTIRKAALFNTCLSVNNYIVKEDLIDIYNLSDKDILFVYEKLILQATNKIQHTLPLSHALCVFCILNINNCANCTYALRHKPCGDHADSTYATIMKRMSKVKNYTAILDFWEWFANISMITNIPLHTTECTYNNVKYIRKNIY